MAVQPAHNRQVSTSQEERSSGFELLRIAAATFVIVAHSWAVCGIIAEPFVILSNGFTHFGDVGVRLFFCLSGYLIAGSIFRSRSIYVFVMRRALRIFPGLLLALLFGLLLAWQSSVFGFFEFFSLPDVWAFLGHNLLLDTRYELPGIFAGHPNHAINGSLWSLPLEVACYGFVIAAFYLAGKRSDAFFLAFLVVYLCMTNTVVSFSEKMVMTHMHHAVICFGFGVAAASYKKTYKLSPGLILVLAIVLWVSGSIPTKHIALDGLVLASVLFFEGVRWKWVDRFAKLGDPSYGLYVFAFPIQQFIFASLSKPTPLIVLMLTIPAVFAISYLSWHQVEKRALAWGHRL